MVTWPPWFWSSDNTVHYGGNPWYRRLLTSLKPQKSNEREKEGSLCLSRAYPPCAKFFPLGPISLRFRQLPTVAPGNQTFNRGCLEHVGNTGYSTYYL